MIDRRALIDREGRALFRYACALAPNGDLARDLWQETAARALAARHGPAEPRAARVWLFRILRNAFIDDLRRRRPEVAPEVAEASAALTFGHDAALIAELTVREALGRLPVAQRELIGLVDIAGFSYAEAAEGLGLPIGRWDGCGSRGSLRRRPDVDRFTALAGRLGAAAAGSLLAEVAADGAPCPA